MLTVMLLLLDQIKCFDQLVNSETPAQKMSTMKIKMLWKKLLRKYIMAEALGFFIASLT